MTLSSLFEILSSIRNSRVEFKVSSTNESWKDHFKLAKCFAIFTISIFTIIQKKIWLDPAIDIFLLKSPKYPFFRYDSSCNFIQYTTVVMLYINMNWVWILRQKVLNPTYQNKFCHLIQLLALKTHCSRITRYPSFIAQDLFHFSTLIHDGDNLNM